MSITIQKKKLSAVTVPDKLTQDSVVEDSSQIVVEESQVVVADEGEDVDVVHEDTDVMNEDVNVVDEDVVNEEEQQDDTVVPDSIQQQQEEEEESEEPKVKEETPKKKKKKSLKEALDKKSKRKQFTPVKNKGKNKGQRLVSVKTLNDYIRKITYDICKDEWGKNKDLRFQKGALKNCRVVAQGFVSGLFKNCAKLMQYKEVATVDLNTLVTCLKFHPHADMFRDKIIELERKMKTIKKERREQRELRKLGFNPKTITEEQKLKLLDKKSQQMLEKLSKIKQEEPSKKRRRDKPQEEEDKSGAEEIENKSLTKLMKKVTA